MQVLIGQVGSAASEEGAAVPGAQAPGASSCGMAMQVTSMRRGYSKHGACGMAMPPRAACMARCCVSRRRT